MSTAGSAFSPQLATSNNASSPLPTTFSEAMSNAKAPFAPPPVSAAAAASQQQQQQQQIVEKEKLERARELVAYDPCAHIGFVAKYIDCVDQLKWHYKPKKNRKGFECYPCRLMDNDNAKHILGKKYEPKSETKTAVQYLTDNLASFVTSSQLQPLLVMTEDDDDEPLISPRHMECYMKTLESKRVSMETRALEMAKLEQIVVWVMRQNQQKQKESEQNDGYRDGDEDDNCHFLSGLTESPKKPEPAAAKMPNSPFSPNETAVKQTLQKGCEIQYYSAWGVAGYRRNARSATISNILHAPADIDDDEFVLEMSNGDLLKADHMVTMVKTICGGKLQENSNKVKQSIHDYILKRSHENEKPNQELCPFSARVNQMKGKLKEQNEAWAKEPDLADISEMMYPQFTPGSPMETKRNKKRRASTKPSAPINKPRNKKRRATTKPAVPKSPHDVVDLTNTP